MSRSYASLTAGLGILCLACCFVTAVSAQTAVDGPGVTVDTGGAVLHRSGIIYPDSARRNRVQGVVTVEATVDAAGNVMETRVLNGPSELRRAAQQSVLSWHFAMDTSVNTRQVKVNFEWTQPATDAAGRTTAQPAFRGPVSQEGRPLTRIQIGGLSEQGRNDLTARLPVHVGDTFAADTMERVRAIVREFDEHLNVATVVIPNGELVLAIQVPGGGIPGDSMLATAVSTTAFPPPPDGTKRLTIGGTVQQAKLVSQPRPVYPPLAKQARISGVVRLTAIIGKEGNVVHLAVISGHPLLVASALEAVQKWAYQKTLLNGEPVEVVTQIDVNYTLSDDPPVQQ